MIAVKHLAKTKTLDRGLMVLSTQWWHHCLRITIYHTKWHFWWNL